MRLCVREVVRRTRQSEKLLECVGEGEKKRQVRGVNPFIVDFIVVI